MTAHGPRKSLPYMPGLDGLRAVAVLGVLVYHADLLWMPGGFLGVEVFFVISGYLITSLLLAEWSASGQDSPDRRPSIDLVGFWLRRARRLLPALYALLVVTAVYAAVRMPGRLSDLRGDLAAAFTYVTNWYLIFRQQSYFQVMGRPSLLKHLWSLAVEEQFYIVWPVLLLLALRLLRRRGAAAAATVGAAASALAMAWLYVPGTDPSRVYYGTDTRAAGLMAGAALAFAWSPWGLSAEIERVKRWRLDFSAALLLLSVVAWMAFTDEANPLLYRGGFLLLDLFTIALIAAVVHPASRVGRALGVSPLRWIGLRSYGIYLWHWPVFMITRPWVDVRLDGPALLAYRLALTFLLAEVSFRWVEQPVRRGDWRAAWQAVRRPPSTWQRPQSLARHARWLGMEAGVLLVLALPVLGVTPLAIRTSGATALAAAEATGTPSSAGAAERATATVTAHLTRPAPASGVPKVGGPTAESRPPLGGARGPTSVPILPVERLREPWIQNAERALAAQRARRAASGRTALADPMLLDPVPGVVGTPAPPFTSTVQVTFIGDSVMLGASSALERVFGPTALVDATVSRQFYAGVETARAYRRAGLLGDAVVVHLGNNGNLNAEEFDDMMAELEGVPHVFFLTLKVPRRWESSANDAVREGVKRWPQAVLVDWREAAYHRPELFMDDGIHLLPPGREFYAYLILDAVERAWGR